MSFRAVGREAQRKQFAEAGNARKINNMSGAATFSGTTYQSRVIAFVYVHILAQARLGWLELFDDTPIGISGETDGPGDDARIEFGDRHPPVEIQAKHGLTAGQKLSEAVARVQDRSGGDETTKVVFVVDRGSSKTVHHDFAADLERYRVDRTDGLRADILRIAAALGSDKDLLKRLFVVALDVDKLSDADWKFAVQLLGTVLEDSAKATAAWDVLVNDAADLCAKKLRRTRTELIALLLTKTFKVRPPQKDERFIRQLELSKRFLLEEKPSAALSVVGVLDADLKGQDVDPNIRYRAAQHRSTALITLGRPTEALIAARQALDIDPKGIHALMNAAYAAAETGDLSLGQRFIDRALEVESENADAWAAAVQILAMAGAQAPDPPPTVGDSDAYQLALAQIAANALDFSTVEAITGRMLTRGARDTKTLHLRIRALAALAEHDQLPAQQDRRADAERLADEAIASLDDNAPLRRKLLVVRAVLRRLRGDGAGADADLEHAAIGGDHDPDAVATLALAQLHSGRADYALQTLRIRAIDEFPMLLVIRAQALTATGDAAGARRDLDEAMSRVDEVAQPDALRILGSEVAIDLIDPDLATRFLDAVTSDALAPEMRSVLRGRVAFQKRDADAMQQHFREAVDAAPPLKAKLLSELAQRLLRLDRTKDAVAIFGEVGVNVLPPPVQRDYASALMQTHDLVRAARLVEDIGGSDAAPDWALSIAAEIAARQGNVNEAVKLFTRIAQKRPDDAYVLFELSRRLLQMREPDAAAGYLDRLTAASPQLRPNDRMAVAHLLKEAGRMEDAMSVALTAFRAAPQDPAIHRGFGTLLVTAPPLMHSATVTDETYVRLTSDDDDVREYVIYRDLPVDPRWKELLLADAEKLGIAGLRLGETVIMHEGTWQEQRWTVAEILPAVVYIFRDVMANFETRFPSEPFFVKMMNLPDENSVKYLTPLISTLQAKKDRAQAIFKMYRENTLPLGFIAAMLGSSIAEVMRALSSADAGLGPLQAEWFDAAGQQESRAAARDAAVVIVTRSGLETLAELELLDIVRTAYAWHAPQSLVEALQIELAGAELKLAEGQRTIMASDTGLRFDETAAGDDTLTARVQHIRRISDWVASHAKVEFRPLETIEPPTSREGEVRPTIGHDSMDAVRLTEHLKAAMFADDLGLRRLLPEGSPGRSFSTVSLIGALSARALIAPQEAHSLLLRLVERNYVAIVPTRALLIHAIQDAGRLSPTVERVFSLLGGPVLDLSIAARIAAETLRAVHLLPLQVVDMARTTETILAALSARWPAQLCARALTNAATMEFALLPQAMKIIRDAVLEFLRRKA